LVDASGRAGLLKRRLGLEQVIDHDVDARWFRVDRAIDVEDWSSELAWRSRTIPGLRRYSTNHLMGHGYWVWLIPLASGGTSVGLVTDARVHDRAALNRFDRVLAWLAQCEPQCAEALAGDGCELQDFKVMYGGAHGCRRVISPDRWAITGEAGVHLDPLYSPGGDFIAVSNTLIAQIIGDDLDGRSIAGTVHFGETVVQSMFEQYLSLYRGQYPVMGSPRVMTAKVCWDTAVYFGYNTLLFQNGRLCDRRFLARARGEIEALRRLQARVQSAFPAWAARDRDECAGGFVDQLAVSFMRDLYLASTPPYTDDDLHARLRVNIDTLEQVAAQMLQRATARDSPRAAAPAIEADVGLLWA
jgi:hypothetical protein